MYYFHALLLFVLKAFHAYIKDKKITSFPSVRAEIECCGVKYNEKDEAVIDENIITWKSYMSHAPILQYFLKIL